MQSESSRRDFLKITMAGAAAGTLCESRGKTQASSGKLRLAKGLVFDMLPERLSLADRFRLARETGFEVVQVPTTPDPRRAEEIKRAADRARIRIDSVMNMAHWKYPLSSSDPAVVQKSLEGMQTSLRNAHLWGAEAVLLVPAVVNAQTTYREAWLRSQRLIRTLLPLAEQLKVIIAIEEVWNKFLLSPLEMARYVDQFNSPWIRAWFDVGNVVLYGYPQDWIHTLGNRIVKLHLKDFKLSTNCYSWVNLGDGDVMWPAVRGALEGISYSGSAICELQAGNRAYLEDLSRRIDRLLRGA